MAFQTIVSSKELAKHLDDADWRIFDARFSLVDKDSGYKAYQQGHIPGSRYIDLERDLSSPVIANSGRHPLPDFSELAIKLSAWGVKRDSQVLVYDDAGGVFAARMWWLLKCLGHQSVAVLDGGINGWQQDGLAVSLDHQRS